MENLAERLGSRPERKPLYDIDDSDDEPSMASMKSQDIVETFERIFRPDAVSPLNDVDRVLDSEMRPTLADDIDASNLGSKQIFVKQYLVKWKGLSYLHCTWVPEREFVKAYKALPRLKTEVSNFNKQRSSLSSSEDDYVAIRPEWTTVDRVLACRDGNGGKEYLVKWMDLSYDECCWESEFDISSFQEAIDKFHKIQSRNKGSLAKKKISLLDASETKEKPKEFQQYENNPEFLSGGSLHPYQLEGLNFLRFSWFKQTHVILADEMCLGKTIQSIAFLASLFEGNLYPHLVVAPLSTLRNWECEFATWAPQMNVVMYAGSAQACAIIREFEFYFPKNYQKSQKNSSSQHVCENKKDRIKFDVLLTSYEMINMDTATLKSIHWECMIVDEGHHLKNRDSKLFSSLKQFSSKHRVLLTGTPLQNNLDELFMLMHFLDAEQFDSLEEFQEEFKDISLEEQISRLHKTLSPHLLRRVKKDVMKDIPPKKERILRVELSSIQKEYYKAILTRNYQILTCKAGAQISLNNVVMELQKLCCHPFMLESVEPEETKEFNKLLLESSGKLQLLDKMMVQLKEQCHRVLIYSQFQHMLDLLEDYCNYRKWKYERIDGKVGGAERQVRIDRFNAKNSSKFCFLLSTKAGGLGINLATADTVIIYDSDWNPHADLQAMARSHRLGQTNKVMVFRIITRGTIEERMMEMTKKKMVLEHLVVGRLKNQNFNQEELDDIISYGSKELFADDNDEAGKSRQIHYDDAAIARLLNCEQVNDGEATMDDEEEERFLKAFQVENFEYVDEVEAEANMVEPMAPIEIAATVHISERASFWEDLLRERYESQKIEEFNSMGIGKRSRKQMVSMEDDDLAGLEDASSEGEDNNYGADLIDGEAVPSGPPAARKTFRKRSRGDASETLPLMEGEGKSFRVLGFNQSQRALFVQILMRFGIGEFDWAEFTPRLKQKSYEEIKDYGMLFLSHISEDITDSPTYLDGVPKEGLRVEDVLVRIAQLLLIRDKVKASSGGRGVPLFGHDVISHYPGLKSGRFWTQEHDLILLRAVLKHGYGRWQAILDDRELQFQDVICREINLPITLPERAPQGQAPGVNQAHTQDPGTSQAQTIPNVSNAEIITNAGNGNDNGIGFASGTPNTASHPLIFQDSNIVYHFRERQRKQVEFIKKRVLLLEKGLNAEYQKAYFANEKLDKVVSDPRVNDAMASKLEDCHTQLLSHLPLVEAFSPEEISAAACDDKSDRLNIPWVYNEMCKVLSENSRDSVNAFLSKEPASLNLRKNLCILEKLDREVNLVLLPVKDDQKQEIHKPQNFDTQESCSGTEKGAAPSDGSTVVSSSVSTVDEIMEDQRL